MVGRQSNDIEHTVITWLYERYVLTVGDGEDGLADDRRSNRDDRSPGPDTGGDDGLQDD